MTRDDIRSHWQKFEDADLLILLNEISDEVKRRNTIMQGLLGSSSPVSQKETIQKGLSALLDALANKPKA